jgi:DNA-binding GntR family transcriptional regulator
MKVPLAPIGLRQHFDEATRGLSSTPDTIAASLREAIRSGLFKDGQRLRQDELAAELGVSKIPVREALRSLEAEGLVRLPPNRGAVVVSLSDAEAQEIVDLRVVLETLALQRAIRNADSRVVHHAADVLDNLDAESDVARWSGLNWEFHATLYQPADRPRLLELIRQQHVQVDRYMRIILSTLGHQDQSQREHRALLSAYEQRDTRRAVAILTKHIEAAGVLLLAYLRQREQVSR